MTRKDTVLVLGATGGIGGEMARQLRDAGWQVRAHAWRGQFSLRRRHRMDQRRCDESRGRGADVARAARGASVIVHAVNPPGYKRWADFVLPMLDNTIAAAKIEGATIVLPGTVYNFGPDAFPLIDDDAPQRPVTTKGAIRVEMEARLERASKEGARVIIVRAGDFFGPNAGNNWFSQGLVTPGKPVRKISVPNARGIGHE
nr:NAD-dependent epimerase/dehydratase family protein [Candidatus Burkholderia verschuerenii]